MGIEMKFWNEQLQGAEDLPRSQARRIKCKSLAQIDTPVAHHIIRACDQTRCPIQHRATPHVIHVHLTNIPLEILSDC